MKHVIAFDVSMGRSYMVLYNHEEKCIFEGEIRHSRPDFEELQERIKGLIDNNGEQPHIPY